jgi:hypothetical protein
MRASRLEQQEEEEKQQEEELEAEIKTYRTL